jgi:3-dehydrosphinganine reductase
MLPTQHAIITGGSSGIGKAIARQLAQRGMHLSIIARRPDMLAQSQAELEQAVSSPNQRILTFSADVSDRPQVEQAIQTAIAQSGGPDWLITCAGIAYPDYFQDIPLEIFEQTMAINYFGTLYCIRAALPAMEQQRSGKIVMISSGAGLVGLYGYTAYCSSKFALRGLAEALRAELKPLGIGVAIAYPPDTDTPQLAAENQTKPPATKQITATASLWQPDRMAQAILQGVDRGQFEITPGTEMTVLAKLHSVIKPVLNSYFDRIVAANPRPTP